VTFESPPNGKIEPYSVLNAYKPKRNLVRKAGVHS
jgi:hypothetical protein